MNAILLVRHLPTAWNVRGVLQGSRNIPIVIPDEPRSSSERRLPLGPFDLVLCSPLQRTRQTAALFGFPDPEVEGLLREIDFGAYEGRPKAELMAPETGWVRDPFNSDLGQEVHDLRGRVEEFFDKYRRRGRVLAFAHGTWMRLAHALYHLGDPSRMNRLVLDNGATLQFELD